MSTYYVRLTKAFNDKGTLVNRDELDKNFKPIKPGGTYLDPAAAAAAAAKVADQGR
jgi:hypothetical protein